MKTNNTATHTPKELFQELQALASEAKGMMTDSLSEHSAEALANLRVRVSAAQERLSEIYDDTKEKVIAGARYTDAKVRENPYQAMAVALGVGVLVGVLVARRSK